MTLPTNLFDRDNIMKEEGFESVVVLSLPGYIFSIESQQLRDHMDSWFAENQLLSGYDVDYLYCDMRQTSQGQGAHQQLNSLVVWFKDAKMAMLFKLVFA